MTVYNNTNYPAPTSANDNPVIDQKIAELEAQGVPIAEDLENLIQQAEKKCPYALAEAINELSNFGAITPQTANALKTAGIDADKLASDYKELKSLNDQVNQLIQEEGGDVPPPPQPLNSGLDSILHSIITNQTPASA